jgi:catechol 2,3-dioxygenase-like lactoylglutathione lyase family enzyme
LLLFLKYVFNLGITLQPKRLFTFQIEPLQPLPKMKLTLCFLITFLSVGTWAQSSVSPIMLDDIHYYVGDTATRKEANDFFRGTFGARAMKEQDINPLTFIDFLQIGHGQSTINVSSPGPFPGIKVGDPKRWQREKLTPSMLTPPQYGVHWLALATPNLKKAVKELNKKGVKFKGEVVLPMDGNTLALALWTFDYNLIVLVERKGLKIKTPYAIDHLQLLVKNLEDNLKFYQEVLNAEILNKKERSAELLIGGHKFILSEPEVLGFDRQVVLKRSPRVFLPNIDHIGFLYANTDSLNTHVNSLVEKGYNFLMKPARMNFYEKPTPYTFCILMSPDGLQIELETEDGRINARTMVKK